MKHHTSRLFLTVCALSWFIAGILFSVNHAPARAAPLPLSDGNSNSVRAAPKANEFRVCNSSGIYSQTIQSAIDAAQPGDVIKVAGGNYIESKPSVSGNLYISKTVYIYGGYTCSDWVNRNPALNISTIRPSTSAISVVDIEGQFANPATVAPTLDGFTITGGGGGNHGGGIRIRDSNALINNNIITGNVAFLLGGGIWVQRGAPLIQNNKVQNNLIPAIL